MIYKDHIRYTFNQFSLCKETHKRLASGLKSAQFPENKSWSVFFVEYTFFFNNAKCRAKIIPNSHECPTFSVSL